MLRLRHPVHIAQMFDRLGRKLPEHSCEFEMKVVEDHFITNRDEIAITSQEFHFGFWIRVYNVFTKELVWSNHYALPINKNQTMRLPKGEIKIPIKVGPPIKMA
jgi:hypothetical protein